MADGWLSKAWHGVGTRRTRISIVTMRSRDHVSNPGLAINIYGAIDQSIREKNYAGTLGLYASASFDEVSIATCR